MNIESIGLGSGGRLCAQHYLGMGCAAPHGHAGDHYGYTGNLDLLKAFVTWNDHMTTEQSEKIKRDIATGPVDWHIELISAGLIAFTLQSRTRSSMQIVMHINQECWETLKITGNMEMAKSLTDNSQRMLGIKRKG